MHGALIKVMELLNTEMLLSSMGYVSITEKASIYTLSVFLKLLKMNWIDVYPAETYLFDIK
jgi:hypothetical protein